VLYTFKVCLADVWKYTPCGHFILFGKNISGDMRENN
jgi:hypothetical protein